MTNTPDTAARTAAFDAQAVQLDGKDLPAYCPNPAMPIWCTHPRVFLVMSSAGKAKCPYCGTDYQLKPGTVHHEH